MARATNSSRKCLIRILVEEGGADMDIRNDDGNRPRDVYVDWRTVQVRKELDRVRKLRSVNDPE
jgi:hypothetical protein